MTYKVTYISASSASRIDRMNRASNDVYLGHTIQALQSASATLATTANAAYAALSASGSYALQAADITASRVVFTTGIAAVHGNIWQVARSGSDMTSYANFVSGSVAGTLVLTKASNVSGSPLLAADVVTWMAF